MLPFTKCNLKLDVSELFDDLKNLIWVRYAYNMPTCILPDKYKNELMRIFKLPKEAYIVVHNLEPIHNMEPKDIPYLTGWHIDSHRDSAIMIPISPDNPNHYTEFVVGTKVEKAPYTRGVPLLFNVKALHKVTNKDPILPRNIIAIGLPNITYDNLVQQYQTGQLIDKNNFGNNLFNSTKLSNV